LADYFAGQFPAKMTRANVIPAFQPTKEFANPLLSALHIPGFLNEFSYTLTELGIKMICKPMKLFRKNAGFRKNIQN
jgi:sterol 3beta-glucosyltransferase